MYPTRLNTDIKKFVKLIKDGTLAPGSDEAKREFTRLHGADPSFMAYNVDSLRSMIILNRLYNYVPVLAPHADL